MYTNLKRQICELETGSCGVGSLTSWYENGVDSQGPHKVANIRNEYAGPLNMFPYLDVKPGAASAFNEATPYSTNFTPFPRNDIDVAKLAYEETLGALHGFRINNNMEFKEEAISYTKLSDGVYDIAGENIEIHAGQAPHGQHAISMEVAAMAKEMAIQHAMGVSQNARDSGLERGTNPAINGTAGEQIYHNTENIRADAETAVEMDIDVIAINGEEVRVEDTQQALDANV